MCISIGPKPAFLDRKNCVSCGLGRRPTGNPCPRACEFGTKEAPEVCREVCMSPGLWLDTWRRRCEPKLDSYVPIPSEKIEPMPNGGWRKRFQSVEHLSTRQLLRCLPDADTAVQYAAGMKLARDCDTSIAATLVAWFLEKRSRYRFRFVNRRREPLRRYLSVAVNSKCMTGDFRGRRRRAMISIEIPAHSRV